MPGAVAAAVFGDPNAIEVQPMTFAERGPALQSGEIDMVTLTTTWTTGREAQWRDFAAIMFYNGQGFMVRADSGFDSALDLGGTTVCVTGSTTTEHDLADFFRENGLSLETAVFEDRLAVYQAYEEARCGVVTDDTPRYRPSGMDLRARTTIGSYRMSSSRSL